MKAGVSSLAASLFAGALLIAAPAGAAAPTFSVAELAQASSLEGGLISAIAALPMGSSETDYEGQLAIAIEQAGDAPAVVTAAISRALAHPDLPRPGIAALRVLLNQARGGRIRTTAAVSGDTVTLDGALFVRGGGVAAYRSFQGGSDYTH